MGVNATVTRDGVKDNEEEYSEDSYHIYGWPMDACVSIDREYFSTSLEGHVVRVNVFVPWGIFVDLLTAIFTLSFVTVLAEFIIRRRETQKLHLA